VRPFFSHNTNDDSNIMALVGDHRTNNASLPPQTPKKRALPDWRRFHLVEK